MSGKKNIKEKILTREEKEKLFKKYFSHCIELFELNNYEIKYFIQSEPEVNDEERISLSSVHYDIVNRLWDTYFYPDGHKDEVDILYSAYHEALELLLAELNVLMLNDNIAYQLKKDLFEPKCKHDIIHKLHNVYFNIHKKEMGL